MRNDGCPKNSTSFVRESVLEAIVVDLESDEGGATLKVSPAPSASLEVMMGV